MVSQKIGLISPSWPFLWSAMVPNDLKGIYEQVPTSSLHIAFFLEKKPTSGWGAKQETTCQLL